MFIFFSGGNLWRDFFPRGRKFGFLYIKHNIFPSWISFCFFQLPFTSPTTTPSSRNFPRVLSWGRYWGKISPPKSFRAFCKVCVVIRFDVYRMRISQGGSSQDFGWSERYDQVKKQLRQLEEAYNIEIQELTNCSRSTPLPSSLDKIKTSLIHWRDSLCWEIPL